MGLFSKKPKKTVDDLATDVSTPPIKAGDTDRDATPVRTQAPKRGKKFSIDPVDFLNLRAELLDMRARLESTEQAKAIVESRLAALDATTTALANDRTGDNTDDLRTKLADIELQLTQRVAAVEPLADRIAAIEPLAERIAAVEPLAGQLSQLNARVSAQAEFGVQLSGLRDRITELQTQVTEQSALSSAAVSDDVNDRVNALADRMAATDGLLNQLGQLAERVSANDVAVRQTTDQVSALEQRLNSVSTELANQVRELGTDIDGLAAQAAQSGDREDGDASEALIESLREGQVKLAKEQARYEIAFREDLASLAEQLRRGVRP